MGGSSKPSLGKSPAYASTLLDPLPGLEIIDSITLKLSCEYAEELRHHFIGDLNELCNRAKSQDIPEEQFFESLEILSSRGYIRGEKVFDRTNRIHYFTITDYGMEQYACNYIKDYGEHARNVGLRLLNSNERNSVQIAPALNISLLLVNHIISMFKARGWVKVIESTSGDFNYYIWEISPELRRAMR